MNNPLGIQRIPLGAEYIVMDSTAYDLSFLHGERRGSCFYPSGHALGFLVRRRTAPVRVLAAQMAAERSAMPPVNAPFSTEDWK